MISYIIPTRNRSMVLARSLGAIGRLPAHAAEVVVVDNASDIPPALPVVLENGIPVRLHFRGSNEGAAARNHGVRVADDASGWVVMLDDDSYPLDDGHVSMLRELPDEVAAVAAEIFLASGRESGGLPEVFTGCGVAIRRRAFIDAGGYDPTFNYYVEEYDLAAKFILAGYRIALDRRFRVMHDKVAGDRDMNVILRRLVRNNAWVAQRYAPRQQRRDELREVFGRYASIAMKEKAVAGYTGGAAEAVATLAKQPARAMTDAMFDRFTGLAEARRSLQDAWSTGPFRSAAIIDAGKNARVVRRALDELGVRVTDDVSGAEARVIGTMSPGPLLDAWERRVVTRGDARLVAPWAGLLCVERPAPWRVPELAA